MLYTIMHFWFARSIVVLCEKARSNELSTNNPTFLGIESKGTRWNCATPFEFAEIVSRILCLWKVSISIDPSESWFIKPKPWSMDYQLMHRNPILSFLIKTENPNHNNFTHQNPILLGVSEIVQEKKLNMSKQAQQF